MQNLLEYMLSNNIDADGKSSVTTHILNKSTISILWEYSYIYGEIFRQCIIDGKWSNSQDLFKNFLRQNNIFINSDLITKFIFTETLRNLYKF